MSNVPAANLNGAPQGGENVNGAPQQEAMAAANPNVAPQGGGNVNEARQREAILIVAVLIITLTYQGLASPSSTFLKEGRTKIDWECLVADESHGVLKSFEDCPAILALLFLIFNTIIFLLSISIVYTTLPGLNLVPERLITVFLVLCYGVLLTAFYHNAVYLALPCAVVAFAVPFLSYLKREIMRLNR